MSAPNDASAPANLLSAAGRLPLQPAAKISTIKIQEKVGDFRLLTAAAWKLSN